MSRRDRSTGTPGGKDFSVLIAVEPPSFQRLIEHLLHGHPGLHVVSRSARGVSITYQAARLAPDVIVVRTRTNGKEHAEVLAELKRSSPASTLILLTHGQSAPIPDPGIDAWLPEDAVVKRLLPVIRKVAPKATYRTPQPASAGPRT